MSNQTLDHARGPTAGVTIDFGDLRSIAVLAAGVEGFRHPAGATGMIRVVLELSLDGEHFWQVPYAALSFTQDATHSVALDGTMTQNDVSILARYARASVTDYIASAGAVSAWVEGAG